MPGPAPISAPASTATPIVVGGKVTGYSDGTGPEGNTPAQAAAKPQGSQVFGVATPPSPLLVTSSQSRTQYNNNVTGLNTALNGATASSTNPSIVDYLKSSGLPSDYASRSALATSKGIQGYTGSASQNTQLLQMLQQKEGSSDTTTPPNPQNPVTPSVTDTPVTPQTPVTPPGTSSDSPATGADDVTKNADGSTNDPNDPTSGLPPSIANAYKDTLTQQDQNITDAQTTLEQAKATLTNDPAATQAASLIQQQYGVLIDAMKAKNNILLGSAKVNAARNGSLQYANDMEESFMSSEMDAASSRLATLVGQEQAALLKSNTAYQNDDVKAFNTAQTALDKATKDKTDTIGKLLTATQNQVKAVQAQQKIDAATKKNALASDVTTSSKIAAGMADAIATAGLKDPAQIDAYLQAVATKNGITNVDILKSALVTAQQAKAKADLAAENTESTIANRGKTKAASTAKAKGGGTDGGYAYTGDDISTYTDLLNTGTVGGQTVNGVTYGARGSDGYVDPGAYTAVYNDWIKNGGTAAGFAKKFPPKATVNPASYSSIPAAIRPTTTTSSAAGGAYPT